MGTPRADWFHVCVFRPSKYGVRAAILNPMPFVAFSRQRGSRFPHAQVLTCLSSSTGYHIPLRDIAVGQLVVVLVRPDCQAAALGDLNPLSRHCLTPESSSHPPPPPPSPLAPCRKCLHRGQVLKLAVLRESGSISEQPSLAKAHPALLAGGSHKQHWQWR